MDDVREMLRQIAERHGIEHLYVSASFKKAHIFLAALQGICANPNFFGPTMAKTPDDAVKFAMETVLAAMRPIKSTTS